MVYVGLMQQTRVLPLAWKVMPGQETWDEGLWEIVGELFTRVKRALGDAECTLLADRGLSGLPLIELCQAQGWHYVLRIKQRSSVAHGAVAPGKPGKQPVTLCRRWADPGMARCAYGKNTTWKSSSVRSGKQDMRTPGSRFRINLLDLSNVL